MIKLFHFDLKSLYLYFILFNTFFIFSFVKNLILLRINVVMKIKSSNFVSIFMGIAIVTILVIVISLYYQSYYEELQQQLEGQSRSEQNNPINNNTKKLLFIFDINNNINLPRWCNDISS